MRSFNKFKKEYGTLYKPLTIDPSIQIAMDIQEILEAAQIKLQSFSDLSVESNHIIIESIFRCLIQSFSLKCVREVFETCIPAHKIKQVERSYYLCELLEKEKDDEI